ncbi:MAG: sodium-independent anion transporter, partial [Anaerolineae bacterium]|nr:sodium-independent anion transporter [Anaerolineae bacterium]
QFETRLHNAGISLELASLNPTALNIIRQSPLGKKLGSERMFLNLEEAVEAHTHASGHGAQ